MLNSHENDTLKNSIYSLKKKKIVKCISNWFSAFVYPSVWSYCMLSAESLKEILLLSVSIQFLLILEVIADRVTSPSRICRPIREIRDTLGIFLSFLSSQSICDKFSHAAEVRSFCRHHIPPLADSDVNKSHRLPHLSTKGKNKQ